tara:strand:- start:309 stop:596 length:288 start_codon:yes stop_codon:yes gene_type:complete
MLLFHAVWFSFAGLVLNDPTSVLSAYEALLDEDVFAPNLRRGCIFDIDPFAVILELEDNSTRTMIQPRRTSSWMIIDSEIEGCLSYYEHDLSMVT